MDTKEAIGILRSEIGPASVLHREIAENMGADALEFQGWLFGEGDNQWIRVEWVMRKWNGEDSFLDFALGEWRVAKGEGMMTTDEQRLFKERAERLEAYRQRIAELEAALAEARKDGERLDWLARRTHWVDERMHLGLRGAIDAARGAK